jgi:hypothetical protein
MENQYLVFDIETPSLKPDTIHMISTYDLLTEETRSYVGLDEVAVAIDILANAKMIVGHYVEGFDLPVITDLTGQKFDSKRVVDTVHLSRKLCQLPNHKLETWGDMVGLPKLPKPDFHVWTPEMTVYCERDCHVTAKAFDVLLDMQVEQGKFVKGYDTILLEFAVAKLALDDPAPVREERLTLKDMPY